MGSGSTTGPESRYAIGTDPTAGTGDCPPQRERPEGISCYIAYCPAETTLDDLIRIAGGRWAVEECFQAAKQEGGLDDHRVRRYPGWHHPMTLTMASHACLTSCAPAGAQVAGPGLGRGRQQLDGFGQRQRLRAPLVRGSGCGGEGEGQEGGSVECDLREHAPLLAVCGRDPPGLGPSLIRESALVVPHGPFPPAATPPVVGC